MTIVLVLVLALGAGVLIFRKTLVENVSPLPDTLGVTNGQLAPCPESNNCVSSQAPESDDVHHVDPFAVTGDDPQAALQTLAQFVQQMPNATLITQRDDYLHAEFRSDFWGFIDDFEAVVDPDAGVIHVRSAARLGREDMGVNRQRVQQIRQRFEGGNA